MVVFPALSSPTMITLCSETNKNSPLYTIYKYNADILELLVFQYSLREVEKGTASMKATSL